MLKLFGTCFLLLGGIWFGVSSAGRLSGRVKQLRSMISAFALLEWELDYNLASVKELMLKTAEKSGEPSASFLRECAEEFTRQEGHELSKIWNKTAKTNLSCLNHYDLEEICSVGAVLGRYDEESQKKSLRCAREKLMLQMKEAEENQKNMSRVYGAVGIAGGAFLALILL